MGVTEVQMTDEQVIFFRDNETGLRGITVLDKRTNGPMVGSCRRRPYDDEERALADALRQAESTAAKAAMAGLPFGGGCTVLLGNPAVASIPTRFQALGRIVDDLHGRFLLMPDVYDTPADMDQAAAVTAHILGVSQQSQVDPSAMTAQGVVQAIDISARHKLGDIGLSGLRIAIMGLSPSGYKLAELLRQQGAKIVVADRDPRRTERAVRELGIACVSMEEIVHLDSDVFAPCAAKDSVTSDVISHLRCKIVAGTADDILTSPEEGRSLHERGILYAPDFLITVGSMISLTAPLLDVDQSDHWFNEQLKAMADRLQGIFDQAAKEGRATYDVALKQLEACLKRDREATQANNLALAGSSSSRISA